MAKRDTSWTLTKYRRFLSENRGAGEFASYKPWLTIQDFPSRGRVTRVKGWKTNRIHHFFSDLQTKCFYAFEWDDEVLDIREHYPLLDLREVVKDNKDLKQEFFSNKEPPYILTTTFLLTTKGNRYIARSVSPAADLGKKSVSDRLEIERRYWQAKQIDFGIITQKDIPNRLVKNVEWIHQSLYSYLERGIGEDSIKVYSGGLLDKFRYNNHSIRKVTSDFDKENDLEEGTGLFVFKYLLASKLIIADMNKPIDIAKRNPEIRIDWFRGDRYAANQ
ncbi:MAG: TnsA endonuclease C-terminal domain-containing protein [Firmicutes bacterium]|nr:TnsA endonuclease C-terminal domain-containing protein [Bacillota bacterium]